jgi:hypothetical protein
MPLPTELLLFFTDSPTELLLFFTDSPTAYAIGY